MEIIKNTICLLVVLTGLSLSVLFIKGMVFNPLSMFFMILLFLGFSFDLHKRKPNGLKKNMRIKPNIYIITKKDFTVDLEKDYLILSYL